MTYQALCNYVTGLNITSTEYQIPELGKTMSRQRNVFTGTLLRGEELVLKMAALH
jgi:hypothetical protein